MLSHLFDNAVLHRDSVAKYAANFLRNSFFSDRLCLQYKAQRLGLSGEIGQDPLAAAFLIFGAGIDVFHPVTQRVVEEHRDLAGRSSDGLRLADPCPQTSVESAQCCVSLADCDGQQDVAQQQPCWTSAAFWTTGPSRQISCCPVPDTATM
jgi:hypothetical protein